MRIALALAALLLPAAAAAQEVLSDAELVGDPAAGREIAASICGECHATEGGPSPVENAPPFDFLAEQAGITGMALNVWLTTFHPERTMPAIILPEEDRRNVIAYILSLGER